MATSKSTIDFITDQLSTLGDIRTRKMFGEYALYYEEKVVALVCDNELFVKITKGGRELVGKRYKEGYPYPGAKPAMVIGAEELDNSERLCELIRATAAEIAPPKPNKKPSARTATAAELPPPKPNKKPSVRTATAAEIAPPKPKSKKNIARSNPRAQSSLSKKSHTKKSPKKKSTRP